MCTVHACTMFLYAQIDTHKAAHMDTFVWECVCVRAVVYFCVYWPVCKER